MSLLFRKAWLSFPSPLYQPTKIQGESPAMLGLGLASNGSDEFGGAKRDPEQVNDAPPTLTVPGESEPQTA